MTRNLSDPGVEIIDSEIYRQDWNGLPRFYWIKIYLEEPITFRSMVEREQERVKVYVQLEGDPTARQEIVCNAEREDILEAVVDCIGDIEFLCAKKWKQEQLGEVSYENL